MELTRAEAFLYLLMRDHLPFGTVISIINELNDAIGIIPTNKDIGRMAIDLNHRMSFPLKEGVN